MAANYEFYLLPIYREAFYRFYRHDTYRAHTCQLIRVQRSELDQPAPEPADLQAALAQFPYEQDDEVLLLLIAATPQELSGGEGFTEPRPEFPFASARTWLENIGRYFTRVLLDNTYPIPLPEEVSFDLRVHHVQALYPMTSLAADYLRTKLPAGVQMEQAVFEREVSQLSQHQQNNRAQQGGRALLKQVGVAEREIKNLEAEYGAYLAAALAGRRARITGRLGVSDDFRKRFVAELFRYDRHDPFPGRTEYGFLYDIAQIATNAHDPEKKISIRDGKSPAYVALEDNRRQYESQPAWETLLALPELEKIRKSLTDASGLRLHLVALTLLKYRAELGETPTAGSLIRSLDDVRASMQQAPGYQRELTLGAYLLGIFYSFENLYDGIYAAREIPLLSKKKRLRFGIESLAEGGKPQPSAGSAAQRTAPEKPPAADTSRSSPAPDLTETAEKPAEKVAEDTSAVAESAPADEREAVNTATDAGPENAPAVEAQAAEAPTAVDTPANPTTEPPVDPEPPQPAATEPPVWLLAFQKGPDKVKGLGRKGIDDMWQQLQPHSPADLLAMCQDGRVRKVKGIGAQTVEALIAALSGPVPDASAGSQMGLALNPASDSERTGSGDVPQ